MQPSADKITRPILRYYGGKWRLATWIISHFPEHVCYVEPFAGAASVLLKKEPSELEVYNDADRHVTNFFRILRDQPKELFRLLKATPYSREEFVNSYNAPETLGQSGPDLEQARRFFFMAWQGYSGPRRRMLTGWKVQRCRWISGRADQITEWNKAKQIIAAARRFRDIQIEQDDALQVILRFDTPDTLFYLDPPYPADTRNKSWCKKGYTLELPGEYHTHLANLLKRIQGMAIISTYPNEQYAELFRDWTRIETTAQTMNKTIATELLYLSPKCAAKLGN